MRRAILLALPVAALAACAPEVPDSGAGVGFGSYSEYLRQREAALAGQGAAPVPVAPRISSEPVASAPLGQPVPATAPQPAAQTSAAPVETVATAPLGTVASAPAAPVDNPGLSDEQDFNAVSARESIQSDRERLQEQRQQYVVVEPTPVPERRGDTGPNIVEFALSTRHEPGARIYGRFGIRLTSPARACARYESPDKAQEAFLARGGPERDPMGLDPDGDGFACGWDPRPFRAAVR